MFPAEFHILGHTVQIDVIAPKDWPHGESCVGVWNPAENQISLVEQHESGMVHAFCHELVHCTLGFMGHRLYSNEVFVDQFGGLLAQILMTLQEKPRKKTAKRTRK